MINVFLTLVKKKRQTRLFHLIAMQNTVGVLSLLIFDAFGGIRTDVNGVT